jgi:hypothetical protein
MYNSIMPKRSSSGDVAQNALRVVEQVIGAPLKAKAKSLLQFTAREKNPAAVALGRLGGRAGGKARAKSLSAERRRAIAQKAAKTRWKAAKKG